MVAVLHCVFMLICLTTLSSSTSFNQTLQLLSILPYPPRPLAPNPSYSEGPTLFLASQLAVDRVNNRTDLLPGYHLELVRGNGGCEVQGEVEIALFEHVLYNENNVHAQGMIGPGCSHSTLRVGNLTRRPQLSLLSVSLAGTTALENRGVFRNTFSILESSQKFVNTIKKISKDQNWKNITVFYDLSRKFFTTVAGMLNQIESSFNFMFMGLFPVELQFTPLSNLPLQCQPHSRIIIFLAGEELVRDILCLLIRNFSDVVYPNFQFIIVNHTPQSLTQNVSMTYNGTVRECSSEDIRSRLNGAILLQYRLDALNRNVITDSGLSYNEFDELYNKSIEFYNNQSDSAEQIEWSDFGAPYFDATWALILALNKSREDLRERTGLELWQYRYGHANATDIVRDHLLQLDFMGVSGKFRLNSATGFVNRWVDIWQFKPGNMYAQRLAYLIDSHATIALYNETEELVVIKAAFEYVLDTDPRLGGLFISLITGLTTLIAVFHIISLIKKSHPSIKATHPKLYQFAYLGNYLTAFGSTLFVIGSVFGISSEVRCVFLYSASALQSIGLVLVFSTLTAIAYRVHRIFVHYMHPGKLISDTYLLAFIVTVPAVYSVLFFVYSIAIFFNGDSVFDFSFVCIKTEGSVVTGAAVCGKGSPVMILVHSLPSVILTAMAAMFGTMSIGHIKIERFKLQPILIVCYFFCISTTVWTVYRGLEFTTESPLSASTAGLGPVVGSTVTNMTICIVFLFLPPTLPVLKGFVKTRLKESCGTHKKNEQIYAGVPAMSQIDLLERSAKRPTKECYRKLK